MKVLAASDRAAAAAAYLTLIPALVLLLLPAFRRNQFVHFHAWQSIFLWGAFFIISVAAIFFSNLAWAAIFLVVGVLASLAMFFVWALLTFKAWQGDRFELPLFGTLAARLS